MSLAVQGLAALQTASMMRPCFAAMGLLQRNGLCRGGQPCRQMHAAPQLQPIQPHHPATTPSWVLHAMPRYRAVLIDAAGTLLVPSENTAEVYLRYGRKYGVELKTNDVLQRFRRAYNTPWRDSRLRYVGDGRPFWRYIVEQSTGCDNEAMFEEVYQYYAHPDAWVLAPGAAAALARMRAAGLRLAVVSNFDTRLRPILLRLGIAHMFDAIVVSAEVGVEKPNPLIYEEALLRLGCGASDVVHVGDDRRNDVWGARDAGVNAWLWGVDVKSFQQVADRLLLGKGYDWADETDEDEAEQG